MKKFQKQSIKGKKGTNGKPHGPLWGAYRSLRTPSDPAPPGYPARPGGAGTGTPHFRIHEPRENAVNLSKTPKRARRISRSASLTQTLPIAQS